MSKKKNISKKLIYLFIFLLFLPIIFADDVNVTVQVIEHPPGSSGWLGYFLYMIGQGTGNLFSSMGVPLAVFIILMAIGTMIGYIFVSLGKKTGE